MANIFHFTAELLSPGKSNYFFSYIYDSFKDETIDFTHQKHNPLKGHS